MRHGTGVRCEGCGQETRRGQFVNLYEDAVEVHVHCDAPYAIPQEPTHDDETGKALTTFVLVGDPALPISVDAKYFGRIGQVR